LPVIDFTDRYDRQKPTGVPFSSELQHDGKNQIDRRAVAGCAYAGIVLEQARGGEMSWRLATKQFEAARNLQLTR
jgi:hypothetical protein